MNIAIITAIPEELKAVRAGLKATSAGIIQGISVWHGTENSHQILATASGMGFENAGRCAAAVIRGWSPDLIISAGFCGGLSEELCVGDTVVATGLAIVANGGVEDIPVPVPDACRNFVARSCPEERLFGGFFVSTPKVIPKKQLAALFSQSARHAVVEMESAAIGLVATEHRIPCAALRCVSDPLDEELLFSLDEFCDDTMTIRIPNVLLTCLKRPRIIPQLVRLAGNSRVAAASLTRSVRKFLETV